jgi:hypothetical protein
VATAGANGGADSDFALASGGAGEQEIGDVGTCNQQNEADSSHQDKESEANIAHQRVSQGNHRDAFVLIHPVRIGDAKLLARDDHVGLRRIHGCARLEAAGGQQIVALVGAVGIGLHGNEDVGRRIGMETSREDADHCVRIAAEKNRPADE